MIKPPVFAAVFAAFVLSGCQPCSKSQIDEPYWTDVEEVYPDDNSVTSSSDSSWTEVYPDDVIVEDDLIVQEEMPVYDSYVSEPYYEERVDAGYWTEYPSFESTEIDDALIDRAMSSSYSRPAYSGQRFPPVSYPSNAWQARFLGNRPAQMYTYPQPNLQQQSTVPPRFQSGRPLDLRRSFR